MKSKKASGKSAEVTTPKKRKGTTSLKALKQIDEEQYRSFSISDLNEKRRRTLKIEEQTRIFASMCPDEILDHYDDYSSRQYYTTLMLGDVSGFTELAEKYTKSGKGGPSKLTETLNTYIGSMVQEILSHNGDVLKFSGDAFIVMWKVQEDKVMSDVAIEAIQTACIIQKHFGSYETNVGVTLKVKLAIASGKIAFTSIGDPDRTSYYIITGKPVWDVKSAEALCRGGDILVAPSCWQWANPNEYFHEILPDGIHTLITGSSLMWERPQESYDLRHDYSVTRRSTTIFPSYSTILAEASVDPDKKTESEPVNNVMQLTGHKNVVDFEMKQVDYSLRPKVIKVAKLRLKNELRSYMLPPIVRSVENDEPIEFLTEMRQVVIVFVNVVTSNVGTKKLILIVDAAYKLVCGIVGEMQGCVNKTSLFDKDLMFLCIFGLRGDKHELESQIGLRCATRVRESLTSMRNVETVTVGVTTGITYCGVVGHILRREYTVIGTIVNKAARLMIAYTDKVTCDRESFLYSRLDAKHFILQEPKYLKGISNVGPIYEFLEQTESEESTIGLNQYPILGRENELKIFTRLLNHAREVWSRRKRGEKISTRKNTLVIRGEPRMGKSRLLGAMTQIVPSEIQCNHITLVPSDRQVPYTLIHLIFSLPLNFETTLTPKEREDKLISSLEKIRYPHYLCALNESFNVAFKCSSRYRSLDENDKRKVLRKLIGKLTNACFDGLWIVFVDDAENIDPESFSLLSEIIKRDRLLFVLSFCKSFVIENKIDPIIMKKSKIIELTGIDKWFHAALACQILDVVAIPPELEKVIQERSMGNPGWIESYLVSLKQAGGINIKKVLLKNLHTTGYVVPPEIMVHRLSTEKNKEVTQIEKVLADRYDGWKMYRMSFAESAIAMAGIKETETQHVDSTDGKIDDQRRVTVCSIPPNFILEDVDTALTMDVMILKLFDSLTPLDQFLLKCAAVLGETVDRNMLEQLMEGTSEREIALAVKKLFEIRIFGCAADNFTRSPGPLMFFRHDRKRNIDVEIHCGCTGLQIREILSDLPKYASCGFMRFKMTLFRETTYRLLTENQKVDFHSKALKYLHQNTRRCDACGGKNFPKLLGRIYPESFKSEKRKLNNFNEMTEFSELIKVSENVDERAEKESQDSSIFDDYKSSCMTFRQNIVKSPIRTFSSLDFTDCQCNLILNTVYSQMLDHYRGIERKDKILMTIIEFVEILLAASNIPQARKLLGEAEQILTEVLFHFVRNYKIKMFAPHRDDELVTLPYLTGKIKTLQGRCHLESGLINEAQTSLEQAIKSLGWNFPRAGIVAQCKSKILLQEQKLILTCLRDWKVGVAQGDAANYDDQLSNSLSQIFIVFREKKMFKHAKLAAVWGLNAAVESSKNFVALCTAYSNMILIAHDFHYSSTIKILETNAMNICSQKSNGIEFHELVAVAKLYSSIFFSRWLRGETSQASELGFIALNISRNVRSVSLRISILPKLIYLLMVECRHDEVVTLLHELEFISNNDMDKSGRTWYYALCVDFQLEAGLTVIPLKMCEEYYQKEGETMINLRDPEAERNYLISMWLWYVRREEWEAATIWESKQVSTFSKWDEHSSSTSIAMVRKLEGLLICYVHKLDNRNAKAATTILIEIKKQFKIIEKLLSIMKIILPRYTLMKSYYNMVRYRKKTSMKLLERAKNIAVKMDNKLIYEWSNHCEKAWNGSLSILQRDFWKERSGRVSRVSWHVIEKKTRRTIPYSLPLPSNPQNLF